MPILPMTKSSLIKYRSMMPDFITAKHSKTAQTVWHTDSWFMTQPTIFFSQPHRNICLRQKRLSISDLRIFFHMMREMTAIRLLSFYTSLDKLVTLFWLGQHKTNTAPDFSKPQNRPSMPKSPIGASNGLLNHKPCHYWLIDEQNFISIMPFSHR